MSSFWRHIKSLRVKYKASPPFKPGDRAYFIHNQYPEDCQEEVEITSPPAILSDHSRRYTVRLLNKPGTLFAHEHELHGANEDYKPEEKSYQAGDRVHYTTTGWESVDSLPASLLGTATGQSQEDPAIVENQKPSRTYEIIPDDNSGNLWVQGNRIAYAEDDSVEEKAFKPGDRVRTSSGMIRRVTSDPRNSVPNREVNGKPLESYDTVRLGGSFGQVHDDYHLEHAEEDPEDVNYQEEKAFNPGDEVETDVGEVEPYTRGVIASGPRRMTGNYPRTINGKPEETYGVRHSDGRILSYFDDELSHAEEDPEDVNYQEEKAYRPGDVVRTLSGQTARVINGPEYANPHVVQVNGNPALELYDVQSLHTGQQVRLAGSDLEYAEEDPNDMVENKNMELKASPDIPKARSFKPKFKPGDVVEGIGINTSDSVMGTVNHVAPRDVAYREYSEPTDDEEIEPETLEEGHHSSHVDQYGNLRRYYRIGSAGNLGYEEDLRRVED